MLSLAQLNFIQGHSTIARAPAKSSFKRKALRAMTPACPAPGVFTLAEPVKRFSCTQSNWTVESPESRDAISFKALAKALPYMQVSKCS